MERGGVHIEAKHSAKRRIQLAHWHHTLGMDNSRDVLMTQLATVDVLIIDDFALEPMNRDESRDVYQLFVERNARASTLVTSNRDTDEWIATFDDALLAQSAVDRFKNNAFDLVVDGDSYRSRLKPSIDTVGPPPAAPVRKVPSQPRRKVTTRRRSVGPYGTSGLATVPNLWRLIPRSRCPSPGPITLARPGPITLASDTASFGTIGPRARRRGRDCDTRIRLRR